MLAGDDRVVFLTPIVERVVDLRGVDIFLRRLHGPLDLVGYLSLEPVRIDPFGSCDLR